MKNAILLLLVFAVVGVAAPNIGLSVNGDTAARIEPGTPLIVSATIIGDEGEDPALSVAGPDGAPADLPFVSRPARTEHITEALVVRTFVWTVAPDALSQLSPGVYTLKAEGARDVTITISSSTTESAESRSSTLLLLSIFEEFEGHTEQAIAHAGEVLAAEPGSIAARLRLADLLEDAGRLQEALVRLDEAEKIFRQAQPSASHPPVTIRERQRRILDAIAGDAEK